MAKITPIELAEKLGKRVVPVSERRKMVREFRKEMNLTLRDLEGITGLSFAMLAKFENGTRTLSEGAWRRVHEPIKKYSKLRGLASQARLQFQLAQKEESYQNLKQQHERLKKWLDENALVQKIDKLCDEVAQLKAFKANVERLQDEHLPRIASEAVQSTPVEQRIEQRVKKAKG